MSALAEDAAMNPRKPKKRKSRSKGLTPEQLRESQRAGGFAAAAQLSEWERRARNVTGMLEAMMEQWEAEGTAKS